MKKDVLVLHEKALKLARTYLEAESDLISVLQQIEQCRGYLDPQIGSKNLFEYATQVLGLSRDVVYNMIAVARKGLQIPALQEMIRSQEITLSNARTIVSVLEPENQATWLQNAAILSKHDLERAVAEVNPRLAVRERVKPVGNSRFELRLGVSDELNSKLKHVQDLLSSRRGKHASLEDALEVMAELFLEEEDPVRKAERAQSRAHARAQTKDQAPTQSQNRTDPETETDTQTDSKTDPKPAPQSFVPGRENNARLKANVTPSEQRPRRETASASNDFPSEEEFMPRKTVPELPKRIPIPASLEHALNLRDRGQCAHLHPDGKRCPEKRWLDFHHILPIELSIEWRTARSLFSSLRFGIDL